MPDFSAREVCELVEGRLVSGEGAARLQGVATDSRDLASGSLFFALSGERFDGHDFCASALDAGAGGVVVSRGVSVPPGTVVIRVDDPLLALGRLAKAYRQRFDLPVIGITGSVGKSTTKAWIATILRGLRRIVASRESYNNEIGLPLTLLELSADTEVAVLEMAMRGRGQIAYLCELAWPQIGVITNLGVSHLELLGSVEGIAAAKAELFESLPPDGIAIADAESEHFAALTAKANCRVVGFGTSDSAEVRAESVQSSTPGQSELRLCFGGQQRQVCLPVPGTHNVRNALAAAAACLSVGLTLAEVVAGLAQVTPPKMRLELIETERGVLVLSDCYNSAPDSARAALEVARDRPVGGRRIAVLGDMKELGPESPRFHRDLGKLVPGAGFAELFAVGDYAESLATGALEAGLPADAATVSSSTDGLIELVLDAAAPGDLVLVKGSRAMELETVVEALRHA